MIAALRKLGYVAGQNLAVDIRYADGNVDQLPRLARGLRLRSAPRLVIRLPRTPPRRGVGPARAGGGHPPEVCSPALPCLRNRPGNLPQHHVDDESSALDPCLTDITKPRVLGLLG